MIPQQYSQGYGQQPFTDPRNKNFYPDNESELLAKILQPDSSTTEKYEPVWDDIKKRYVRKTSSRPFQELNSMDLTSANFEGARFDQAYAWHSLVLLAELEMIHTKSGLDVHEMITFHRNLLMTFSSLSKSTNGTLLKAFTTKELKTVQEFRGGGIEDQENAKKRWLGLF